MRTHTVLLSGLVLVVAGTTDVLAQSRSAALSVSVVVRPRCVVDVGDRDGAARVSLSCSSQGTRGVQVRVDTRGSAAAPTVTGPNRLEYRLTVNNSQRVVTLQF